MMLSTRRCIHAYAHRLLTRARETGLTLDQLKAQAREHARAKEREEAAALVASLRRQLPHAKTLPDAQQGPPPSNVRRDSSPVKPLSSILNLSKLVATPHTPSQISALWTAYHASRTNGTGRGYICASLPLDAYNAMTRAAKKYPLFVVPVPRQSSPDSPASEDGPAHEFFFLQWAFHPAPPVPSAADPNPFERTTSGPSAHLPEASTVLFTPLQEYKLRASFATPYLALTFYTDLSQSHGIVLLRGEITPSSAPAQTDRQAPQRFFLDQVDAQLLAMGLQKFYLWGEGKKDGDHDRTAEMLLKRFHEEPGKFSWQDLLKFSNLAA